MHTQSILSLVVSLIGAATALPLDASLGVGERDVDKALGPRCGTTIYPSYISWIDSRSPNAPQGPVNIVSTIANSANHIFRVAEVQFEVPAGVPGPCQLEYVFPNDANITASGMTQLSVYKTSSDITIHDTWGNAPTPTFQFGTFNPVAGTSGVINSEGCQTTLNYFVQDFEQWQLTSGQPLSGIVEFPQASMPGCESGLKLSYGC